MRCLAIVVGLVATGLAGCSSSTGMEAISMAEGFDVAQREASEWDDGATLVFAFGVERDAATPMPAWLADDEDVPPEVRQATDDLVGDGRAAWWVYVFQARMTTHAALFAVAAEGAVLGPLPWDGGTDEDGDPVAWPHVGQAIDSQEASVTLRAHPEWPAGGGPVTWELFRFETDGPPHWLARNGDGDATVAAALDAQTGEVVCVGAGDGSVSFGSSRGGSFGTVTLVAGETGAFELDAGHDRLEFEFTGSSEPLNEVEFILTSPSGQATSWTWTTGDSPIRGSVPGPEGGTWRTEFRQSMGVLSSFQLQWETIGAHVSC